MSPGAATDTESLPGSLPSTEVQVTKYQYKYKCKLQASGCKRCIVGGWRNWLKRKKHLRSDTVRSLVYLPLPLSLGLTVKHRMRHVT